MKKQGYLLLVLLMSAFVFCSCGQKDTKEAQDQTEETTKDTKEDSKTKETKDTKKENKTTDGRCPGGKGCKGHGRTCRRD